MSQYKPPTQKPAQQQATYGGRGYAQNATGYQSSHSPSGYGKTGYGGGTYSPPQGYGSYNTGNPLTATSIGGIPLMTTHGGRPGQATGGSLSDYYQGGYGQQSGSQTGQIMPGGFQAQPVSQPISQPISQPSSPAPVAVPQSGQGSPTFDAASFAPSFQAGGSPTGYGGTGYSSREEMRNAQNAGPLAGLINQPITHSQSSPQSMLQSLGLGGNFSAAYGGGQDQQRLAQMAMQQYQPPQPQQQPQQQQPQQFQQQPIQQQFQPQSQPQGLSADAQAQQRFEQQQAQFEAEQARQQREYANISRFGDPQGEQSHQQQQFQQQIPPQLQMLLGGQSGQPAFGQTPQQSQLLQMLGLGPQQQQPFGGFGGGTLGQILGRQQQAMPQQPVSAQSLAVPASQPTGQPPAAPAENPLRGLSSQEFDSMDPQQRRELLEKAGPRHVIGGPNQGNGGWKNWLRQHRSQVMV